MSRERVEEARRRFSRRHLRRCGADGKPLYLTIEGTAAYFGVAKHAVLEWIKLGMVPEYHLGGRIYLNREEILQYWSMFQTRR